MNIIFKILSGAFLFLIFCAFAYAGTSTITPGLSITQEYRDNITFSQNNEREDYITRARGSLAVEKETAKMNAGLLFAIEHAMYQDYDELDDTDYSCSAEYENNATERFSFGFGAEWSKRALRGAEADTTGVALTGDSEKYGGTLDAGYMLSEVTRLSTSISADRTTLEESPEEETGDLVNVNLEYSRNLSAIWENVTGLVNLSYQNYSSETDNSNTGVILFPRSYREYNSDVWQLTFGVSKQASELIAYYIQAGAGYVETAETYTQFAVGGGTLTSTADDDSTTGVLVAGITYDGLYWDVNLSGFRDYRSGSGTNGVSERTSVSLDLSAHLYSDFWFTCSSSCILNQNERTSSDDLDKLTYSITPGIRYLISKDFILSAGYQHTTIEDRQDDTSKESNLVFFRITKNFNYDID